MSSELLLNIGTYLWLAGIIYVLGTNFIKVFWEDPQAMIFYMMFLAVYCGSIYGLSVLVTYIKGV